MLSSFISIPHAAGIDTVRHIFPLPSAIHFHFYRKQTTSTIAGFFVALALYPDVQKHAQDELDATIGRDRLTDFQDRHQLPYVEAICQELRRWRLVAPFGNRLLHINA